MFSLRPTHGAHQRGLLLILLAAVCWGTVGVTTQSVYRLTDASPLAVAFLRLALSLPALGLTSAALLGRRAVRVERRHLALMLLMGAMLAGYQLCYFSALPLVGVAIATLVTLCTAPVLVALLSAWLLRERLTARLGLALLAALAGTALLVDLPGAGNRSAVALGGVGLALGSALGYAVLTICSRSVAAYYHPLQPVTIAFTAGAALLLPVALPNGLTLDYPLPAWGLLIYLGVVPTALAYSLFTLGMRHTSATAASILTLLEPLTAAALAWLLFGERLGPLGGVGAALLLSAVVLLSSGARDRRGSESADSSAMRLLLHARRTMLEQR